MKIYIIVLCFILFDVITGFVKGLAKEGVNSTALRVGLFHKLGEILALAGAGGLNYAVDYIDLGVNIPLLQSVAVYICVMELVSIVENICAVNPQLTKFFEPYLEKLKGGAEDAKGD